METLTVKKTNGKATKSNVAEIKSKNVPTLPKIRGTKVSIKEETKTVSDENKVVEQAKKQKYLLLKLQ